MPLRYYSRSFYEQTNLLLSSSDADLERRIPALRAHGEQVDEHGADGVATGAGTFSMRRGFASCIVGLEEPLLGISQRDIVAKEGEDGAVGARLAQRARAHPTGSTVPEATEGGELQIVYVIAALPLISFSFEQDIELIVSKLCVGVRQHSTEPKPAIDACSHLF